MEILTYLFDVFGAVLVISASLPTIFFIFCLFFYLPILSVELLIWFLKKLNIIKNERFSLMGTWGILNPVYVYSIISFLAVISMFYLGIFQFLLNMFLEALL